MAYLKGELGVVKFDNNAGTANEVAGTKSWSVTVKKDVQEPTVQGGTYKSFIGGLLSAEGSVTLVYDVSRGSSSKVLQFMQDCNTANDNANAVFEFYPDGNTSSNNTKKISFSGIVTSTEFGATLGEIQEVVVNFISSGTITHAL